MTALLVATTGGHLAQLAELASRLESLDVHRHWVTFDEPQSRSLLADADVTFIPFIAERDIAGVCRGIVYAKRILAEVRPSAVVSTGSAIALSFLPLAALYGIPAHYIESAARVGRASLTGRLLQFVPGLNLYRQYPQAAHGRWRFVGSVFEGFRAEPTERRRVRSVVVTLGGVRQSFRRLLERVVAILPSDVDVLWQTGHTPVDGLGIHCRPFLPASELHAAIRDCDVVVAHGGCGSALAALAAGKSPVIVPRAAQSAELVDGHQVEVAHWLAERGLAFVRSAEALIFADLEAAAACRVTRVSRPPPLRLEGS